MKTFVLMLSLLSTVAFAEDKLIIAAASSSGTYHAMLNELSEFCSTDDFHLEEAKIKGGATDNLDALAKNRVSAAFLHSDVIYAMAQADPAYRDLKTLVSLYPEEIHIIALRQSRTKTAGKFGTSFGSQTIEFNSLADLKGFKLGAAGGGVITARLLTGQGEGHFDVIPFDSGTDLIPALDSGAIDAAIFVGGAPLANIEGLSNKYKLIPIPESISSRLTGTYRNATVNYPNLKSGTVRTIAPMAGIFTRKYKSPKMTAPQAKFRECFYSHLDELKETPGKHAKWQLVDPADHGTWDWYEIPGVSTAGQEANAATPVPLTRGKTKK